MQLILADEDMAIDVGSIMVSGALRAGGPDCRLASHITFTFHPQSGVDVYNMVGGGWAWHLMQRGSILWALACACAVCSWAQHGSALHLEGTAPPLLMS